MVVYSLVLRLPKTFISQLWRNSLQLWNRIGLGTRLGFMDLIWCSMWICKVQLHVECNSSLQFKCQSSITSITWYLSSDSCSRGGHMGPSRSPAGHDGISQDISSSFHCEGTWRRSYCSCCCSHVIYGCVWGAQHGGCATSADKKHRKHSWYTAIQRFVTTLRAVRIAIDLTGDIPIRPIPRPQSTSAQKSTVL